MWIESSAMRILLDGASRKKGKLMPINVWDVCERLGNFDPYPLMRNFLFMMDPEKAHELGIRMLKMGLGPDAREEDAPSLRTTLFGLDFSNPVMLAAGLDKQAEAMDGLLRLGFGAIELGSVTPRPQPGNPRPRMFRVEEAKGLINRFGFNSVGVDVFVERLKAWREKNPNPSGWVGVNLGKNKDTVDDADDYVAGLAKAAPYADFVVVNVSSPNTPGLRDLQGRERMERLLSRVMAARNEHAPSVPVLVKIAPDLTEDALRDIVAVALSSGVHGIIVSNTTISRPEVVPMHLQKEVGGLSGKPLFEMSNRVLAMTYRLAGGTLPIIGCGGISSGEDAYRKIRAGASMVQIYTSLVYEGPLVARKIKRELALLLSRDGFKSVADAVGVDCVTIS